MGGEKKQRDGKKWTRREFLVATGAALPVLSTAKFLGAGRAFASHRGPNVIVLGIDGMDHRLVARYAREGRMPNALRLMQSGTFSALGTTTPPQSPVAWSSFIAGANPGVHGIYDFIHRDPATFAPYLSTSRMPPPGKTLSIGSWRFPLSAGEAENLRRGPTFWKDLEEEGVDCTIVKMPANFPPTPCRSRTLSGLGTPDVLGTYGTFTYFTTDPSEVRDNVSGGKIVHLRFQDDRAEGDILGPPNSFRKGEPVTKVPLTIWRDQSNPVAMLDVQGEEIVLKEGEWSDWVRVRYDVIPAALDLLPGMDDLPGICRFYLKSVHPELRLYVSPVNIDPAQPALPISTPAKYARELADNLGPFYTQGMPEDTKALSAGVFTDEEYIQHATLVLKERLALYDYELGRFQGGFFFFYFSCLDLDSHMFWRVLDPGHPLYTSDLEKKHGDFMPFLYAEMDKVIGKAIDRLGDDDMLIVMSDHGFTSFRRGFNLNTWLYENGYAALIDPLSQEGTEFFSNTDWRRTKAYGLGINSLYLNMAGREFAGIVSPGEEAKRLGRELAERLRAVKDPETGADVMANVYLREEAYSGPCAKDAPDLVIGYNDNYRASWETILGEYPRKLITDNSDPWSGDHCMDHTLIPAILMTNRPLRVPIPDITDLAPSILSFFGVPKPPGMTGRVVLG